MPVQLCRGAEDEVDAASGVLLQAGFDGLEELFIFDEAWYDGPDGSWVPVEVAVLTRMLETARVDEGGALGPYIRE